MIHLDLQPELEAQLTAEAHARGLDLDRYVAEIVSTRAEAMDQHLLDLAAEADAREGIRQGLEDLRAGRARPAEEVFDELRARYALPR